MYFQIENTPEHIRRARKVEVVQEDSPREECPRLILAPFSRPPQVVFDNVLIGSTCERNLEVLNPSKQVQQISLGRALPPGLIIHLPGEWLVLEPETCYILSMMWTPTQPTAMRETIRFTNENRGRYDVIVVLKAVMNIKGKSKAFKISPGKVKKKSSKKSPVAIYKKKAEIIYNTTQIKKSVMNVQSTQYKVYQSSNKENTSIYNDYSLRSFTDKCPFDSPTSIDFKFDTSEVFSNMRRTNTEAILQQTYDKSYSNTLNVPLNVLRPSNKQVNEPPPADIFDNLTFTPLKTIPSKSDKLDKGPKIVLSMNSESDFDDSLDLKGSNKENETHSIISITTSQPPNKWLTVNHHTQTETALMETPTVVKKHPNTSSPKELNSPNFSINTEFSRISDLSFFPQRFSTERKGVMKVNNETQELIDEMNCHFRPSSDTYTKDSPNTPLEHNLHQAHPELRPPHFFLREQHPKMCKQSLFREYHQQREPIDKNLLSPYEQLIWQTDLRTDIKSPPRSLTPPLQSIPEESAQMSDTHTLDRTDTQSTFTINRTFDKTHDKTSNTQTWSKKAIRAEPDLWKVPVAFAKKSMKQRASIKGKESLCGKISNTTFDCNKSINQNISVNQIGNVYSQSLTVDPFLSSTYFYDEEAVDKFEKEFKRWLNCILTPPADLDSNVEQKIDVGKAWIENRNKEVPAAPTREQVCSKYHNSHRLESLRRSARALLISAEITQVLQKLNAQIEKKLIAIRTDRNLHLDVGLQKAIMEVLLSYNPLWLRIGLEAIYGVVLPMRSNSDIEALTTFIIQRMFKNPHLKNKHSKSSAPNMLLPAYMEAIKKFTLKKFFMFVFFLDQAKQRKLIPHDPCLFCRNAVCKDSREVVIRFTRELIAGIGDITKHLRPLGYVVSHKQSYLDEYKYAVHNIALDLRDGVRLTKVMEIILMKNGLLSQLRTPPISRLQKIHNMNVALNALKEADFTIDGDISAVDIADGHREKTLSLLWQLIHVFRAPLFQTAANVIQTWWRKKYAVIVEKRMEEEKIRQSREDAATAIQCWWRRIQYNRLAEWQMQQVSVATLVLQKYCRMWLCRTRLRIVKRSVLYIQQWYRAAKLAKQARETLEKLRLERQELMHKSAIVLQSYTRRWLCKKQYRMQVKKVVLIQSVVRQYLIRKKYLELKKTVSFIQQKYRGKLMMRLEMQKLAQIRNSAITIQSYYRMLKQRKLFATIKWAVRVTENRYLALIQMRIEREKFVHLKKAAVVLQALYRSKKSRAEYMRQRNLIIQLQRRVRANQLRKKDRRKFISLKKAAIILQMYTKSYLTMKQIRQEYLSTRKSVVTIQKYFRLYLLTKSQRISYLLMRSATINIQRRYRGLLQTRQEQATFKALKSAAVTVQRSYRANIAMRQCRGTYSHLRRATVTIQRRYRAQKLMREQRTKYLKLKSSCITIQKAYKSYKLTQERRQEFLAKKQAATKIQSWFRSCKHAKQVKQAYKETRDACVVIQKMYRAYVVGRKQRQEYLRIRTATVCIQKYYRCYIEMKTVREQYMKLQAASVTIQRHFRSYVEMKKQRNEYLKQKAAASVIAIYYRRYKETQTIRNKYCELRHAVTTVQKRYRSICAMRIERDQYITLKQSATTLQRKYRALLAMRKERQRYLQLRSSICTIQIRFRAQKLMQVERSNYLMLLQACTRVQRFYRAYIAGRQQRSLYLKQRESTIVLQRRYRALLAMRRDMRAYKAIQAAAVTIQSRFRARCLMLRDKSNYTKTLRACITIQRAFRAYLAGKKERLRFIKLRSMVILIQNQYRMVLECKKIRSQYQQLRKAVLFTQRRYRANKIERLTRRNEAAVKIQIWYLSLKKKIDCRSNYLTMKRSATIIQSTFRMHIARKRFLTLKRATVTIQRQYRAYKLGTRERRSYLTSRASLIRVQSYVRSFIERKHYLRIRSAVITIQAAYRLKRQRDIIKARREQAALCLQKNIRRYMVQSRYTCYREKVVFIQKIWRGKLVTRLMRCEFLQKKTIIIKLQSIIRGYLVRKQVELKRENLLKIREENRRYWAASKIQALFRGHKARMGIAHDKRVAELRFRWRNGALQSNQESLKERNEEAMEVLRNMSDIETVIRAFRSLELLTEVFPMLYCHNASSIVRRVYIYMSVTNRSISSIEVLKSAASVLVNLTRYKVTGPKIYARDRISPILKFMWRFSNSETQLFCILSTYIWLFSKYDDVRKDLQDFLHLPENHKMLVTTKGNIVRMKRMTNNSSKNKFYTPQPSKFISHTNQSFNLSVCSNGKGGMVLPALEPDYGIIRVDKPRYFEDAQQAIDCLFQTYKL